MKIIVLSLVILLAMVSCTKGQEEASVRLIVVRHAEKATEPAGDPALTEAGNERARLLSELLLQEQVTAIYSTPFRRNQETVKPLADRLGLEITTYQPGNTGEFLSRILKEHPGEVVVICGHSNTVPAILNFLVREERYENLDESDYNDLFVIAANEDEAADIVQLTYDPQGKEAQ